VPQPIQLIFNADDFGFTRDVNEGIVEAHRNGVLTATTLMANGDAFDDAVACAKRTPSLDVGVHLVLVQGQSVSTPGRALPATLQDLARALLRRELAVYDEASAQVRRIIAAGIQPSHIDTHKHTHLFPPVLEAVAKIAKEFGIPWVRRPFDYGTGRGAGIAKRAVSAGMKLMQPRFAKALAGLRMTDHFTGFRMTGTLDEAAMVEILETLPAGLTEFMCHPGKCGPELQGAATRLKESRAIELAALMSPEVRRAIERQGIKLTNYRAQ
jgi:hopanoid biosynthesis associated protein HpnK